MKLDVKFTELTNSFETVFGEVHNISDGGFERGYAEGETKGYEKGYTEGEVKGFEDGAKSEYDRFWDAIQNKGDYSCSNINNLDLPRNTHLFGLGWTNATFKPKYDVIVLDANTFVYSEIEDLRPETVGVNIDFSRLNNFNYILRKAKTKYIGVVDMTNATTGWCVLRGAENLEYVEKLILPIKDLEFQNGGFAIDNLMHIAFENEFLSYVAFNWCTKLTHQSLINILNALYDYVNGDLDGSSKNKTCTLGATNLAKLTDAEIAIATEKGWTLA